MNSYPIILAHGIARFDFLLQRFSQDFSTLGINFGLASDGLNYFKGVARHLRKQGFDVYQSSVGFASPVEERAADLKREIETALALRPEQGKVHIIAHSMGGLDARHMIVNHGMANQIASLTTIGTPHLGTSFADWGFANQGDDILNVVGRVIDLGGFADLTTSTCNTFNKAFEASEASNAVVYQTYGSSETEKQIFFLLQSSCRIIQANEGENDGLVPLSSQMWKSELIDGTGIIKPIRQHVFPVSADHLNEIGWWDMNQLRTDDFQLTNFFLDAQNYEKRIRDVYLEIARNLQTLS